MRLLVVFGMAGLAFGTDLEREDCPEELCGDEPADRVFLRPGDPINEFEFLRNDPDLCYEPFKRQLGAAEKIERGALPAIPPHGGFEYAYVTSGSCQDCGYEDVMDLVECSEIMDKCYYKGISFLNEFVVNPSLPPGCWPFTPDFYFSFIRGGGTDLLATFGNAVGPPLATGLLACVNTEVETPRHQDARTFKIGPCGPDNPDRPAACDNLMLPSACSPLVPCYCKIPELIQSKAEFIAHKRTLHGHGHGHSRLGAVVADMGYTGVAAAGAGMMAVAAAAVWGFKRKSDYTTVPEAGPLAAA